MSSIQYPDILKLKTIEYEINLLMKAYETGDTTYKQYIQSKNYSDAAKKLTELTAINDMIELNVSTREDLLTELMKDGSIVEPSYPEIQTLATNLKTQHEEVDRLQKDIYNVDGDLDNTEKDQKSNYLQYITLLLVGIAVMGLTVKTIITKDDTLLDNAIMVIIIGLIIYFSLNKLSNY